jgi:hypothetical protein
MWFAGLGISAVNEVVELWQRLQSPLVGCGARGRVTIVTPKNVLPASWQVAQGMLVTAAWFMVAPAQVVKFVGE